MSDDREIPPKGYPVMVFNGDHYFRPMFSNGSLNKDGKIRCYFLSKSGVRIIKKYRSFKHWRPLTKSQKYFGTRTPPKGTVVLIKKIHSGIPFNYELMFSNGIVEEYKGLEVYICKQYNSISYAKVWKCVPQFENKPNNKKTFELTNETRDLIDSYHKNKLIKEVSNV